MMNIEWLKQAVKFACCFVACHLVSAVAAEDFDARDPAEFAKLLPAGAKLKQLATGMKFTEGPVWVNADGGYLVFSDCPAAELKKWSEKDGLGTFHKFDLGPNGNTIDRDGRLVCCQYGARRVIRFEKGGEIAVLSDSFGGKKFSSPNDVVVKSDGSIYFTDPGYGLKADLRELPKFYIFRITPDSKEPQMLCDEIDRPNGLCFSPDEKRLYVADSFDKGAKNVRVFDVKADGALENCRVFYAVDKGVPDGIRCDSDGRVWITAGDGVHIVAPDGKLIGKILVPECPANCCFGGADFKTLFITARKSLYSIETNVKGAK